ncbi:hypothetical protein AcW1_003513 [Taiwanofungus camphoratus]|nr:hypothetical protein AcV5_002022 [Antrodia cinnamomea]KAI0941694.1 hypothetical protein AcW1_003513 [Antrodia cinnamomea]KAI0943814.1 hypothetical protein AcV7_001799 [Antrodia cinnamomea]
MADNTQQDTPRRVRTKNRRCVGQLSESQKSALAFMIRSVLCLLSIFHHLQCERDFEVGGCTSEDVLDERLSKSSNSHGGRLFPFTIPSVKPTSRPAIGSTAFPYCAFAL